jgi:phage-related protein
MNSGNKVDSAGPANQQDDRQSLKNEAAESIDKVTWEGGEIHPDDIDANGEYIAGKASQNSDNLKPNHQGKAG